MVLAIMYKLVQSNDQILCSRDRMKVTFLDIQFIENRFARERGANLYIVSEKIC